MNLDQLGASPGYTFAYHRLDSNLEQFLWSIDRLSELGYKNFGLEILEPPHTAIYEQRGATDRLLNRSRQTGVSFPSFTPWHCCTNLTSTQEERRRLGIQQFLEGVRIANDLGITRVTIGSDWPPEWVSKYAVEYEHGPAVEFFVSSSEEYGRVLSGYVAALSECLEIAEKHHIQLGLEPRANCLVSSADGFLRIWNKLASDHFCCVLDVMHCAYHREDVPVAIKKLGSRLGEIQICGTDGQTLSHLRLKDDAADRKVTKALHEIDFKGILCVELYGMPPEQVDAAYRQSREILERQITALNS